MTHETETTAEAWLDDARDEEPYMLLDEEFGTAECPVIEVDEHAIAKQLTLDGM